MKSDHKKIAKTILENHKNELTHKEEFILEKVAAGASLFGVPGFDFETSEMGVFLSLINQYGHEEKQ